MVKHLRAAAAVAAASLLLAACGSSSADESDSGASSSAPSTVTVEDNNGEQTVPSPPKSVVATDNRTFETLSDWGVEIKAGAVSLMPDTISYTKDTKIVDLGSHNEPKLEAIVAADPDVVVNGQRFTQFHDKIKQLVPDATVLALDPRDGKPFFDELKRQTTVLGEVFDKKTEAKKLTDDFDAAVARAKAAYQPEDTVMGVIATGGKIGYVAPKSGRTLGPVFEVLGLKPALEVKDSGTGDKGDDISVEAIAKSNPTWILALDRDAAIAADEAGYKPANEVLDGSAALKSVTAVKEKNVVYMPADTYTNEGIQTYTEFFNSFADALEAKKG